MQIEVTADSGTILYTSRVTGGAGGPGQYNNNPSSS